MRICWLIIICWGLVACQSAPTPTLTAPPSATASATATLSRAQITALATFQPTLPASFTPTFTPTITPTATNSQTPRPSPTPTALPEALLCADLLVATPFVAGNLPPERENSYLQVFIPYDNVEIVLEIRDLAADRVIDTGILAGGRPWFLDFWQATYPHDGSYQWRISLRDATRDTLCERQATFVIRTSATGTVTPESTTRPTSTPLDFPSP